MNAQILPEGWALANIGEVTILVGSRDPRHTPSEWFDYIEIGAVPNGGGEPGTSRIPGSDAPSRARQEVIAGDVLMSTVRVNLRKIANVPNGLVRPLASTGFCVLRAAPAINPRYLFHVVQLDSVVEELSAKQRGVSYPAIRNRDVFETKIPLPPLAEQHRIVEAVEAAFSKLNAGVAYLNTAKKRLALLAKAVIVEAVPSSVPDSWRVVTVEEAGVLDLGRQRHPNWHSGPNMKPYLRVANVFEDRIDTRDVMEMHFEPDVFERFKLTVGDVLLNEGQSPELLGRPAMYRGDPPNVAFTNSLIRFRAGTHVAPEWALLMFRRHLHAGRFMKESRITTNIAHLSAGRLKAIEFPLPPYDEQLSIVEQINTQLSEIVAMRAQVELGLQRAQSLRRAILGAAFSGQLVPQDPTDEPAIKLLERIATTRSASESPTRTRPPRAVTTGASN